MNVLLIGCGKMGGAMLSRWIDNHLGQFTVVDPDASSVPPGATLLRSVHDIANRRFDVVVGAIKPQLFDAVLPSYKKVIQNSGFFLSIAAGYSIEKIEQLVGEQPVIRAMPNLPALIGEGVTGMTANKLCHASHLCDARKLAKAVGKTYWLDNEDEIDRLTAIAGSGPGYVFEMTQSYIEAAKGLGFSGAMARDLVLQTMAGAVTMALESDKPVVTLRNSVTSKNGTTEAGLQPLTQDGAMADLMERATKAAYERARELS